MTKIKNLRTTILNIISVAVMAVFMPLSVWAVDYQTEINRLNQEIANNEAQANTLAQQANTLENKIASIQTEINGLQAQIDKTQAEINLTKQQIADAEAKLAEKKRILAENVKQLYKTGDLNTLEILASSDNFSEFVSRQEYLEKVKVAVQEATKAIAKLKTELEVKEKDLTLLLDKHKVQQDILRNKRQEEEKLLIQTRGEEARYQQLIADLAAQRNQAEQQLLAQLQAGTITGGDGAGTAVYAGQSVSAGQIIGYVGDSGFAEGPHLHFVLIQGGSYTNPSPYLGGGVEWPVPGYTEISQPYGCVPNTWYNQGGCPPGWSFHRGIDIAAPYGSPVVATEGGTVTFAGCWAGSGFGNVVILDHNNGKQTYYPHMGSGCY